MKDIKQFIEIGHFVIEPVILISGDVLRVQIANNLFLKWYALGPCMVAGISPNGPFDIIGNPIPERILTQDPPQPKPRIDWDDDDDWEEDDYYHEDDYYDDDEDDD